MTAVGLARWLAALATVCLAGCAGGSRPLAATGLSQALGAGPRWQVQVDLPAGFVDTTADYLEAVAAGRERARQRHQTVDPAFVPLLAFRDGDELLSCWLDLLQPAPGWLAERPATADLAWRLSDGLMRRVMHTRREDLLRDGLEAPVFDQPLPRRGEVTESTALQIGPLGGWRQRFRFEWPDQPGPVQPAMHGFTMAVSVAPEALSDPQRLLAAERDGQWVLAHCIAGGSEIWAKTKLDEGQEVLGSLKVRPAP